MTAQRYEFHHEWWLAARPAEVYAVLAEVASYPTWWPQVRWVVQTDERTGHVGCRSFLPYTLDLTLRSEVEDPDSGLLEVAVSGDLTGWCRWALSEESGGTRLLFDQDVAVEGRVLQLGGRLLRPVLVANHTWMMRGARRGLQSLMASRSVEGAGPSAGARVAGER